MGAERRLLEETRYKSMVLHVVDVLLLQRTFATTLAQINFLLLLLGHVIVVGHGGGGGGGGWYWLVKLKLGFALMEVGVTGCKWVNEIFEM